MGRRGEKKKRHRAVAPLSEFPASDPPRHPITPSPHLPVSLSPRPPITLLTDFGIADYFVGAMKGVILSANAGLDIVDLTHEIPPGDISVAAFTLLAAYGSFPAGTIHVAVVDPGVGSSRRPLLVLAGKQFFVGPDNGVFSYLIERESDARVFHLTSDEYFRHPLSSTFHGRDVFAPVAAALSTGLKPEKLGVEINDPVRLASVVPVRLKNGGYRARILHIDHFGNCVTSLTPRELTAEMIAGGARLRVNGKIVKTFRRFFAEHDESREKLFAFWGSAGFLELAALNRSAAKILKAKTGQAVVVVKRRVNGAYHVS